MTSQLPLYFNSRLVGQNTIDSTRLRFPNQTSDDSLGSTLRSILWKYFWQRQNSYRPNRFCI